MSRTWSLTVVAAVLSWFAAMFVVSRMLAGHIRPRSFDSIWTTTDVVVRAVSFFVRPSESAFTAQLAGWEWFPQLTALVLLALLTYAAVRAVGAGLGRVGVLVIGSFVLAMGMSNIVAMAIVVLRNDELWASVPAPESDVSWSTIVSTTVHLWPDDPLYAGFLMALAIGISLALYAVLGLVVRATRPTNVLRLFPPAPLIRDVPRAAARSATVGVIPIALLAFVGGADTSHYAYERYERPTVFQNLSDWTFYPRLRPTAPPDTGIGFDITVPLERWLPESVVAVVAIVVLWLVLRWAVATFKLRGQVSSAAVFAAAWSLVTVAFVVTGVLDAALASQLADQPSRTGFVPHLMDRLPVAARFAVLWGWSAALVVTLFHRRVRQVAPVAPAADQPPQ